MGRLDKDYFIAPTIFFLSLLSKNSKKTMSAFQDIIRRVECEDGEKNLALRRQFNERVRAARQLTGGARGETEIIVYYDPKYAKKIPKTRYEGGIRYYENIPHGWGTMTYSNGYRLTGMFVDGSREGPFTCVDDDGDESEVCFENDKYTEKKTCAPIDLGEGVRMGTIVYKPMPVDGIRCGWRDVEGGRSYRVILSPEQYRTVNFQTFLPQNHYSAGYLNRISDWDFDAADDIPESGPVRDRHNIDLTLFRNPR